MTDSSYSLQKKLPIEDVNSAKNQVERRQNGTLDNDMGVNQRIKVNDAQMNNSIPFWQTTYFRVMIGIFIILLIALGIFLGCYFGIPSKNAESFSNATTNLVEDNTKDKMGNAPNGQNSTSNEEDIKIYYHVKLNTTSAFCLDGSPGSYYISKTGDPSKILIYFSGGGWCMGEDNQTTLESCYQRSKTDHGSSNYFWQIYSYFPGILSDNQDNYFRDWKRVFFTYCDGAGHQGYRKDPIQYKDSQLYFRGHNITIEKFQDLNRKLGLFTNQNQIVLTGESAGGLAVYTWANYLKEKVQKGKLVAVPDAGIFYDAKNKDTQTHSYKENLANLMKLSNAEVDFPAPECLKEFPDAKENCFLAQNLYKYMKVPYFAVQSLYDTWALMFNYGVGCIYNEGLENCTNEELAFIEENRKNVMGILQQVAKDKKNGVFGISCRIHGNLNKNLAFDSNFTVPQLSEFTSIKVIAKWIEHPDGDNVHLDSEAWPNNQPCSMLTSG